MPSAKPFLPSLGTRGYSGRFELSSSFSSLLGSVQPAERSGLFAGAARVRSYPLSRSGSPGREGRAATWAARPSTRCPWALSTWERGPGRLGAKGIASFVRG